MTQFEATDCRRAIPCWDGLSHLLAHAVQQRIKALCESSERGYSAIRHRSPRPPIVRLSRSFLCPVASRRAEPAIKAVFAVTLVVDPTQAAISNMPVLRTETILATPAEQKLDRACRGLVVPRGYIRYTYADSPVMSSYLLAFVVGEFDYLSAFTAPVPGVEGSGRVELRIYTPVGQTKQGEFAMDVALKCLALYEKFFQLPYPLPKLVSAHTRHKRPRQERLRGDLNCAERRRALDSQHAILFC